MSDKTLQRLPLALAALLTCLSAHADFTSEDGRARLSGFGTVGAARTNSDDALFNYPGQGGGVDKQVGMEVDTKVGLQGTYKFTDAISGTAQLLTKYRAEGQYQPEFEWAFAKWQATPGLSIRAGRIGAPYFMVSDFRDVGFANTAIRPPLDVYGQVPVSSADGGDISYQMNLGGATITSTLWGGSAKNKYASALRSSGVNVDPVTVKLKNGVGLNFNIELDDGLAFRVGHSQGKLTIESDTIDALLTGFNGIANNGAAPSNLRAIAAQAASSILTENTKATFTGVGASLDRDNIVLAAEYTLRRVKNGSVGDTTGWYALGGYRFGSFLPYVIVSKLKFDGSNAAVPSNLSSLNALGTQAQRLVASTPVALSTQYVQQSTNSVGVRWDAMRNTAVKVQFDHIKKPANSNGLLLVADPATANAADFRANKKNINVISLAVDFVF